MNKQSYHDHITTVTFVTICIKASRQGQRFAISSVFPQFLETAGFQLFLSLIESNHILLLHSFSYLIAITGSFFFPSWDIVSMLKLRKSLPACSQSGRLCAKGECAFTLVPTGHLTSFILIRLLSTLLVMLHASWCRLISSYRSA